MNNYKLSGLLAATSIFALSTMAFSPQADALTVRDDVTVGGSETLADDPQWDGVVQIFMGYPGGSINYNCTGTLINPRTVLSAAHCFNDYPSTYYGSNGEPLTPIIAYGPDTFTALFGWLDAGASGTSFEFDARNGLVLGNQVIIHPDADPAFGSALGFPAADVAMVSLSSPLANIPSYSMLFSPVGVGEHVTMVGYGGHGVGSTGDVGIDGKRQAGENLIGMLGSQVDFLSAIFGTDASAAYAGDPGASQSMYWIDFDSPVRTGEECGRDGIGDWACSDGTDWWYFDNPFTNTWFNTSLSNDIFPGDALPNEAGTAGGDSGSAIFFDQLGDQPLIGGVLSGGYGFLSPVPSGYGDVSYYNPLYNFYEFISIANPYKYVSAVGGDGNWSDAEHWVQDLDPGYFIIDENGNLVNGLPDAPEPGVGGTDPSEGVVLDVDINPDTSGETDATSTGVNAAADVSLASLSRPANQSVPGAIFNGTSDIGTGVVSMAREGGSVDGTATPELITYLYGDIGTPGPLAGPGSTGFVPTNGLNADGYFNYFDVTLSQAGTTTVDMDVVIDSLTLANTDAGLYIPEEYLLLSLIEAQIIGGTVQADGILASRDVLNFGGMLTGGGTILADTVWNAGLLAPTEGMTMLSDLVLTSQSIFGYSGASLLVDGDVSLNGGVMFGTPYAWGDQGLLIEYTGEATGELAETDLAGVLYASFASGAGLVYYEIEAADFSTELPDTADSNVRAIADHLDDARGSLALSSIYSQIDYMSGEPLADSLYSLLPDTSFSVRNVAVASAEQVSTHLARRFSSIKAGKADGQAVNQMGGSPIQTASLDGMSAFAMSAAAAADGEPAAAKEGWGTFVELAYMTGDETNSLTGNDSDLDGYSITAGGDAQIDDGLRLGAFFNYSDAENSGSATLGSVESSGFFVGAYGLYDFDNGVNLSGYYGIGETDYDITRVQMLTGGMTLGETNATQAIGGVALSSLYGVSSSVFFEPSVSVEYFNADLDAYTESGTAGGLIIDSRSITSTQAKIGTLVHFFDPAGDAGFRPTLGLRYVQDLSADDEAVVSRFAGTNFGSFTTVSGDLDDNWFEAEARAQFVKSDRYEVSGFLTQTLDRDDLDYTSFGLNIRMKF